MLTMDPSVGILNLLKAFFKGDAWVVEVTEMLELCFGLTTRPSDTLLASMLPWSQTHWDAYHAFVDAHDPQFAVPDLILAALFRCRAAPERPCRSSPSNLVLLRTMRDRAVDDCVVDVLPYLMAAGASMDGSSTQGSGNPPLVRAVATENVRVARALYALGARDAFEHASRVAPPAALAGPLSFLIDCVPRWASKQHWGDNTSSNRPSTFWAQGNVFSIGRWVNQILFPDIPCKPPNTPLHSPFVRSESRMQLYMELVPGLTVDSHDAAGFTPLMRAAQLGDIQKMEALIHKGADIRMCTRKGNDALCMAACEGHVEAVLLLLSHGVPASGRALIAALRRNHTPAGHVLLSAGADVNWLDDKGENALCVAAVSGDIDLMEALLHHGSCVNVASSTHACTALHSVVATGSLPCVELLLHHGANPNAASIAGRTPLHIAVGMSHLPIVTSLLDHGADIDAPLVGSGYTALVLALMKGDARMAEFLCQYGPDPNIMLGTVSLLNVTSIPAASRRPVARLLLDNGCDSRTRNSIGHIPAVTAFYISITSGVSLSKDLLMATGCCIDEITGLAALRYALQMRSYGGGEYTCDALIQLLLAAGVDCRSE